MSVAVGIRVGEALGDEAHLGPRFTQADARLQAPNHTQVFHVSHLGQALSAVVVRFGHSITGRDPQLRATRKVETRRHDAHDDEGVAAYRHLSTENGWIRTEP